MTHSCPICRATDPVSFFEWPAMPASIGIQWTSEEEARSCKRGDIALMFCGQCGFIWNDRFDPARLEYSQRYDNSLDFSSVFREYAQGLARRLISTYELRNKDVIEIGCGKGYFLNLICAEGENRGTGYDPSYEGERENRFASAMVTYHQNFYGEGSAVEHGDLLCCRHVLEHIPNVSDFLASVRRTIGPQSSAVLYFEVPDVRLILKRLSLWDIIYEHCNYFSRESLINIFAAAGFEILRVDETYGGQFLSLDARVRSQGAWTSGQPIDLAELRSLVARFRREARSLVAYWQGRVDDIRRKRQRAVIWGAGSKAVSFANALRTEEVISHVVDINPHKQDHFLGGTGQRIVAPDFLRSFRPEVIILMNPIYQTEVELELQTMGVQAELLDVC